MFNNHISYREKWTLLAVLLYMQESTLLFICYPLQ